MSVRLKDKFLGCIAGGYIGSAMGAPVYGMHWTEIRKKYGCLDHFLEYTTDGIWIRPAGTTEAGVERQKVFAEAILSKNDRVWVEDVRKSWLAVFDETKMGKTMEPFDVTLLNIAKTTVPGRDIGKYCDYSAFISFPGSCQPIALINAGSTENADLNMLNVGQLYQVSNSRGIRWAQLVGVAIAAATMPGAVVSTVMEAVMAFPMDPMMRREVLMHTEATKNMKPEQLREYFDRFYNGAGIPYVYHSANEIVTKALCIFQVANGDARTAIITAVNMGRGAAATASLAGSLVGALNGTASVPAEWLETVDRATLQSPYTCSRRTITETAECLYAAFVGRMLRMKQFADEMDLL